MDALGMESRYYSFEEGGWHFIVLDSIHATETSSYVAMLDEGQYAWLEEELAGVEDARPVCVISHIPILSVGPYLFSDARDRIRNEKSGR